MRDKIGEKPVIMLLKESSRTKFSENSKVIRVFGLKAILKPSTIRPAIIITVVEIKATLGKLLMMKRKCGWAITNKTQKIAKYNI